MPEAHREPPPRIYKIAAGLVSPGSLSRIPYGQPFTLLRLIVQHKRIVRHFAAFQDAVVVAAALGDIAHAKSMTQLVRKTRHASILEESPHFGVRQLRYNTTAERAMEEARNILSGKISANSYSSAEEVFAALNSD